MQVKRYLVGMNPGIGSPIERFTRNMFTQVIEKLSSFLAKSDFTISEVAALHIIDQGTALPITAIASRLNLSVSATSRLLAALEKKGLLVRKEHAGDSRVKLASCTKTGKRLLDKMSLERSQAALEVITKLPPPMSNRILAALSDYTQAE